MNSCVSYCCSCKMDLEELHGSFPLSPGILRLTVIVLMLLFFFTPVQGQPQVIGSLQPIMAALGEDVILPCHVEPRVNVAGLTVEWSKPDLRPDPRDRLSRVEYVHLYRNSREVPDMKLSSYMSRTTLFADGLRQGNISLKITNVTLEDEGRYRCFIPKLRGQTQYSIVQLIIGPNTNSWATETPPQTQSLQTPRLTEETDVKGDLSSRSRMVSVVVFVLFVLLILGVAVYFSANKCQKQELMKVTPV